MAEKPKKETYKTGDTPGKGTYRCTTCGLEKVLNNDTEALPNCSMCGGPVTWLKRK